MNIKIIIIVLLVMTMMISLYAETTQNTRAIETFPYIENFETAVPPALPSGWTVEDTNLDGITWVTRAINGYSAPYAVACDYNDVISMNDWFFTPSLHLINNVTYRIKFSFRCEYGFYPEKLEVKWGSAASSADMFSTALFSNANIVNESFQQTTISFLVTTRGEGERAFYNIGWHGFSDPFQWTLWVDNITIEELTTVPVFHTDTNSYDFGLQQVALKSQPKVVTISNSGASLLSLTACSITGTNASDFELVDTNTYPVSLNESTTMNVSVRFHPQALGAKSAILRFIENGTIIHDIPFTGTSADYTITSFPFFENFETGALPQNWVKQADGAGWRFGSNLGRGSFPIPSHTIYAAVNKNTSIFEYDPLPGRNDFLIPPPFNMTLGSGIPHLTFQSYFTANNGEHAYV